MALGMFPIPVSWSMVILENFNGMEWGTRAGNAPEAINPRLSVGLRCKLVSVCTRLNHTISKSQTTLVGKTFSFIEKIPKHIKTLKSEFLQ